MLVDDNADMREYLSSLLATNDETTGVADGREGICMNEFRMLFEATLPRLVPAEDIGDTNVYGAQQHAPLLDVESPL
jgi:CheY-like chemotaxis protein